MSKRVKLRDGSLVERCLLCNRSWEEVKHTSRGLCRGCARKQQHKQRKTTATDSVPSHKPSQYDKVKKALEREGYKLISTHYYDRETKLKCFCDQGHEWEFTWFLWRRGTRCAQCSYDRKKKVDIFAIRNEMSLEGYELLTNHYINNTGVLKTRCPNKTDYETNWKLWSAGHRCSCCGRNPPITIEKIRTAFESENYTLLETEYKGLFEKMKYRCPNGHYHHISWKLWNTAKVRCPYCINVTSQAQQEIVDYFEGQLTLINNERAILAPRHLDIYFPNHKLAIEYCGLYWHSVIEDEKHKRITPSYHYQKLKACNEKGIRLITIFEDEWINNKELCLSRINAALGIVQTRIPARKTILQEIDKDTARDFLNKYHLQGSSSREVAFGLFHEGLLVSVMTLGNLSRLHAAKGRRVLELKRFASLPNHIIVGGASKLFKRAVEYAKQRGYDEIYSYCDMRWGTGNVYKKLGFTLVRASHYTCQYTDFIKRFRNQAFASKDGKTEAERVSEAKVYRIYDCGHQTWIYNL